MAQVRHVQIEEGWCVYMTDLDSFQTANEEGEFDADGEYLQQGPFQGDITGPIGQVKLVAQNNLFVSLRGILQLN